MYGLTNGDFLLTWKSTCVPQIGQLTAGDVAYLLKSFSLIKQPLIF